MVKKILGRTLQELRTLPRFAYVLAVITAFGLGVGFYRLAVGLDATTNLSKDFPWGIWISFDLTTVALSGGAFTLAALVYVFHMHDLHPATRPTVLFGLLGYSAVLVILFFDLGRWDRFWHFLVYPNVNSALFEVSWCIALYSIVLFYEFSPAILENRGRDRLLKFIKKYTIVLVIIGVTLSSMHQSSLGTLFVIMSTRLHPLWYSMLLPVFFLVSSLAAGIALVITGSIVSSKLFGRTLNSRIIEKLGWFMPWLLSFYLALKLGELLLTEELDLLFTSGPYSVLYLVELTIGVVIPIILFSIKKVRLSRSGSLIAALFVIAGIVINRFSTSWFAMAPVDGVMYSPSWMEVAILVGVASGVLLVFTLVTRFFPVFKETTRVGTPETQPAAASAVPVAAPATARSETA
jgi:Ni/Fe-hydrogenase subunit HybB-like protein